MRTITREEYMKDPGKLHHAYYLQIARDIGVSPREDFVRRMMRGEKIPLWEWEVWADGVLTFQRERVWAAFRKRGDVPSLGRAVCALQAIVVDEVERRERWNKFLTWEEADLWGEYWEERWRFADEP